MIYISKYTKSDVYYLNLSVIFVGYQCLIIKNCNLSYFKELQAALTIAKTL